MQPLMSRDVGAEPFQAYYCPECDEVRWCPPARPNCFSGDLDNDHAAILLPVWVQR